MEVQGGNKAEPVPARHITHVEAELIGLAALAAEMSECVMTRREELVGAAPTCGVNSNDMNPGIMGLIDSNLRSIRESIEETIEFIKSV